MTHTNATRAPTCPASAARRVRLPRRASCRRARHRLLILLLVYACPAPSKIKVSDFGCSVKWALLNHRRRMRENQHRF
eukprot:g7416.t1